MHVPNKSASRVRMLPYQVLFQLDRSRHLRARGRLLSESAFAIPLYNQHMFVAVHAADVSICEASLNCLIHPVVRSNIARHHILPTLLHRVFFFCAQLFHQIQDQTQLTFSSSFVSAFEPQ